MAWGPTVRQFMNNNRNVLKLLQFSLVCFLLVCLLHLAGRTVFSDIPQLADTQGLDGDTQNSNTEGITPRLRTKSLSGQTMLEAARGSTILCFGDSLTRGLYVAPDGEWRKVHPYSLRLNDLLRNESTSVAAGVNGELTKDMVERLPGELAANPATRIVVILGGTNDLGHRIPARTVVANLIKLHTIAHNHTYHDPDRPTFTVAVTIPNARWPFDPQARLDINSGLRAFAKSNCHVALLDLESHRNQSVAENSPFWSPDFVHLSPEGYDEIGELLYNRLRTFEFMC